MRQLLLFLMLMTSSTLAIQAQESAKTMTDDDDYLYLSISVEPSYANVMIDDMMMMTDNGHFLARLKKGTHRYSVMAYGYKTQTGEVTLGESKVSLCVKLERANVINSTAAISDSNTVSLQAQRISFAFQEGLYDTTLKNKMESTISDLLTEFNAAYREGRRLRLENFKLSDKARRSLTFTWDSIASFTCDDDRNISKCLTSVTEKMVREIYITLHPRKLQGFTGNVNRELSIGFTDDGTISFVRPISDDINYRHVFLLGSDLTDMRRRQEILNFVEELHGYYEEKNIDGLQQIICKDAIASTDTTRKSASKDNFQRQGTGFDKIIKTNGDYLKNLKEIFECTTSVKVKFMDVEVMAHPGRDGVYGLSMMQYLTAKDSLGETKCENSGHLFMLWEFPDSSHDHPFIHLCTWQPEKNDDGSILKEEEKIDLNNFFIVGRK